MICKKEGGERERESESERESDRERERKRKKVREGAREERYSSYAKG